MTLRTGPGRATDASRAVTDRDDVLLGLADRVVALVRAHDGGGSRLEANVQVVAVRHGLTRFANSFVHQHVGEDTLAVELTLASDGRTTTSSTTRTGDRQLERLVDDAVTAAAHQPVDAHWPGATPPAQPRHRGALDASTAAAGPDERARLVRDFVTAGGGLNAAGYADTEVTRAAFASTAGQRVTGATGRATLDGIQRTATTSGSAHATSARIGDLDGPRLGAAAAERARLALSSASLEPGRHEVVLAPEAAGTLLTFLAFYGFNAKAHLEGASFAQLGEQQLDPAVTLLEDPWDPRAVGLPFDAEGTPRERFALIDSGVTTALAHDRRTAARTQAVSTGSAIPGGAAFGAVPTHLVMPPGSRGPASLVAAVRRGLLISQFNYVRVLDPKTLVATGLTRNGTFLIEDGEVVGEVGNVRFTQGLLEALAPGRVLGVGDDDRHADAEFGPGMVICPSLHLAEWQITGDGRG